MKGFTYVAPSILEEMQKSARIITPRSPRRRRRPNDQQIQFALAQRNQLSGQCNLASAYQQSHHHHHHTPSHLQPFAPRPSPQDEMMDVQQGLPIL